MPDSLPTSVYVTSIEEIVWGGILLAITMVLHGLGMLAVLRMNLRLTSRFGKTPSFIADISALILASWTILFVHLVEVVVWAGFFLWKKAFVNASTCYYFSLNEYTTVGSALGLPLHWRLLEGMIAAAGLLTFAWSTGVLLVLAQNFQDRQLAAFRHRKIGCAGSDATADGTPD
jgi:voltage-gated potassium channel